MQEIYHLEPTEDGVGLVISKDNTKREKVFITR